MADNTVHLGTLEIASTVSGLKLELSSLAHLVASEEDESDLQTLLTTDKLDDQSSPRPWVRNGGSYRLLLTFNLADNVILNPGAHIMDVLASHIGTAKLWQQLHLRVESVSSSSKTATQLDALTVCLNHDHGNDDSSRATPHKLGRNVPVYDVEPPPGHHILEIDTVHLAMSLSQPAMCKRQKVIRMNGGTESINSRGSEVADIDKTRNVHVSSQTSLASTKIPADPAANFAEPEQDRLSHEDFPDDQDDMLILDGPDYEIEIASLSSTPPSLLKRTSDNLDSEEENPLTADTDDFLDLVDAALRLAITPCPLRMPKGIKARKNTGLICLSAFAPALWSPGYLANVSHRAVFLPTISHALANVARNNLEASEEVPTVAVPAAASRAWVSKERIPVVIPKKSLQRDISLKLWRMMQSKLYDDRSAKYLKRLSETADSTILDAQVDRDEDLLDAHFNDDDEFGPAAYAATCSGLRKPNEELLHKSDNNVGNRLLYEGDGTDLHRDNGSADIGGPDLLSLSDGEDYDAGEDFLSAHVGMYVSHLPNLTLKTPLQACDISRIRGFPSANVDAVSPAMVS